MSNLPSEPEFEQVRDLTVPISSSWLIAIQAVQEIASTLEPFLAKHPEYRKALDIVQIPERIIQFRVTYERDDGSVAVNRGYRVQFNSALGPYKGGLRLVVVTQSKEELT
jgi:glutamate dehydrogenase (NADP+)